MPELVACPSCGFRLQLAEVFLGRRVRCLACAQTFTAAPGPPAPQARSASEATPTQARSASEGTAYPLQEEEAPPAPGRSLPPEASGLSRHRLPLCPGCHRPVSWEALACPHCGHLFDPLDAGAGGEGLRRRDALPHRGKLIDSFGTLSVLGGCASFCTGPLGILAAVGFGIPALVMARSDLGRMREGVIDPEGRSLTEFGQNKSVIGIALAVLGGLFFFLAFVESGPFFFLKLLLLLAPSST
jgi:hypothetical protein